MIANAYNSTSSVSLLPALCALGCANAAPDDVELTALQLSAADCTTVDWARAQLTMQQDNAKLSEVRAELSDNQLCVQVTGTDISRAKYNLFVETDAKLSTGIQPPDWKISGADYFVYNGDLFRATSALFDGTNQHLGSARVPVPEPDRLLLQIPLSPEEARQNIGIGFQLTQNEVGKERLPQHLAFERLGGGHVGDELRNDVCPKLSEQLDPLPLAPQPRRSAPFTSGMIAPIYLPPTASAAQWQTYNRKFKKCN